MVGKICKWVSAILLILEAIGSVVLAFVLESFFVFLAGLLGGFIFALLLYVLGEIIDLLEVSNGNTYEIYQLLKKSVRAEEKKNNV